MESCYLAIDIGASSGRHILGYVEHGQIILEEVYRFDNRQIHKDGHDCWDMDNLWNGVLNGLKVCREKNKIPVSIGIDTWAVDYVLLDRNKKLCCDAVSYRDGRTAGMDEVVSKEISLSELYGRTGIQKQIFNTVYQLIAQEKEHPGNLADAGCFLMIPEYLNFLLTGKIMNEYTNATTTSLVNARMKTWDFELMERLGIPTDLFGRPHMPGTVVGGLTEEIQKIVGFNSTVILPATHDTGSAFLSIPAKDDNAVCLSSGTWSLLGVENSKPITTEASRIKNFTNEGGFEYRFRYLKNIMGLWMVQSIRRELNGDSYVSGVTGKHTGKDEGKCIGEDPEKCISKDNGRCIGGGIAGYAGEHKYSFPDLIGEAKKAESFPSVIDVNRDCFLAPDSMIGAVQDECRRMGQPVPETVGEIMQCVYRSLAKCYADTVSELSGLTGRNYTSIHIVGGGCQDMYLNEMTAKAYGLLVCAGPVEGTAIGNLIVQMIRAKEFASLKEARNSIRKSFDIKEVKPC